MRKVIVILVTIVFILLVLAISGYADTRYSTRAQVLSVNNTSTLFVDTAGYVWEVSDTNYTKGQSIMLYFYNNTTDYTREDDIIVKIKPIKER